MSELKPLLCIVCGFQPESAFPIDGGTYQPHGATMFSGSGHYGSTVWDPMAGGYSLMITVCDTCLVKRKDRAVVVITTRRAPDIEYTPWDVEEPADE